MMTGLICTMKLERLDKETVKLGVAIMSEEEFLELIG